MLNYYYDEDNSHDDRFYHQKRFGGDATTVWHVVYNIGRYRNQTLIVMTENEEKATRALLWNHPSAKVVSITRAQDMVRRQAPRKVSVTRPRTSFRRCAATAPAP